jgi:general secretion pathway protein D
MRIAISAILILTGIAMITMLAAQEQPGPVEPVAPESVEEVTPPPPIISPTPAPTPTPSPIVRPTTTPASSFSGGDELIPFTFENMQLSSIIKLVAESTGRNFLIQTPIAGTILIYCPKMIPASTALDMLGIILDSQGYTMALSDNPPLIYVTKKAGVAPIPTTVKVDGEQLTEKRELATLLMVLQYVSVDDMQDILRNFKSPTCIMTAYPAGNFLILKDDEASLKYLLEITKKIDIPGTASKVTFKDLKYADAVETATTLTELLAEKVGGRVTTTAPGTTTPPLPGRPRTPTAPTAVGSPSIVGTAAPLKIMADQRTNRLIILASEKDTEEILKLIKEIDVEPTEDMYPIRTYIAQYQDAADLADTLASFVSGQPRARTTSTTRTARTGQTVRSRTLGQAQTTTGQTAAQAVPRGPVAAGTEEAFFLADPATNMVLVQGPPQKLETYMELLQKLDQPQKQVLIEVWVVEISSKNQLDIGVEFKSAEIGPAEKVGPMQNEIFGGSNFDLGLDTLLSGTGFASSGISLGIRTLTNTSLKVGDKVYYLPNFDTFLRAQREDTGLNILQSPKLLTLNNETASVDVSDEISIAESSITGYSTGQTDGGVLPGGVTETYRRTDVGVSLEITPQINSENSVIMEVDLLVGYIVGVADITQAGSQPVIANRSTITKVRVDNGRTIVISGLRRADKTQTVTRVPLLGEIPILGLLFSHQKTLTTHTNLLVFITPHIVSDTLDMLEVTETIKNQNLEEERPRFQATQQSRKHKPLKSKESSGLDWKK